VTCAAASSSSAAVASRFASHEAIAATAHTASTIETHTRTALARVVVASGRAPEGEGDGAIALHVQQPTCRARVAGIPRRSSAAKLRGLEARREIFRIGIRKISGRRRIHRRIESGFLGK
jgi:hypothetical protein